MKKMISFVLVLVLLCVGLSGCSGKSDDVNSVMRSHNYKEDEIKFDDIEWLVELDTAEKKIKDSLITTEVYRDERIEIEKEKYGYNQGVVYYKGTKDDEEKYRYSIGKIAGWDINEISIKYIEYNSKKYVLRYIIRIADKEKNTNIIVDDLVNKIDNKYGYEYRYNGDDKLYDFEWRDKNNNEITILKRTKNVTIGYECKDAVEYITKIYKDFKSKNLSKDSKGL